MMGLKHTIADDTQDAEFDDAALYLALVPDASPRVKEYNVGVCCDKGSWQGDGTAAGTSEANPKAEFSEKTIRDQ